MSKEIWVTFLSAGAIFTVYLNRARIELSILTMAQFATLTILMGIVTLFHMKDLKEIEEKIEELK